MCHSRDIFTGQCCSQPLVCVIINSMPMWLGWRSEKLVTQITAWFCGSRGTSKLLVSRSTQTVMRSNEKPRKKNLTSYIVKYILRISSSYFIPRYLFRRNEMCLHQDLPNCSWRLYHKIHSCEQLNAEVR